MQSAFSTAQRALSGVMADLETLAMFAMAGSLKSEHVSDSFTEHRELILRSAKMLVEDTKSLVCASRTTASSASSSSSSASSSNGHNGQHDINDNEASDENSSTSTTSGNSSSSSNTVSGHLSRTVSNVNSSGEMEMPAKLQSITQTLATLADAVKYGAASLGSEHANAQVLLVNAILDVARALIDLIETIGGGCGGSASSAAAESSLGITESAKAMIGSVHSLLKTVKAVEDESVCGVRALDASLDAIRLEIQTNVSILVNNNNNNKASSNSSSSSSDAPVNANPEDLIKATKQITLATSKAVGAANSMRQEDMIAAANMGRKAVSDLLYVCRQIMHKMA